MKNKRYIGTYRGEKELLDKINEMKMQGFDENDMYVVANNEDRVSMVRGQTDVGLTSPEHTGWMQKFKSYFTGEEPVHEALTGMGFSDEEAAGYNREAAEGGLLLFVDRDEIHEGGVTDEPMTGMTGHTPHVDDPLMGDPNYQQRVGAEAMLDRETERDHDLHKVDARDRDRGILGKHDNDRDHGVLGRKDHDKDHGILGKHDHDRGLHRHDEHDPHLTATSNRSDAEMEVLNEELGSDEIKPFNSGFGEDVNKKPISNPELTRDPHMHDERNPDMEKHMGTGLGADTTKPFREGEAMRSQRSATLGAHGEAESPRMREERLKLEKENKGLKSKRRDDEDPLI